MNHAQTALRKLIDRGEHLNEDESFELFCEILDGETTIAQNAAIATAIRITGPNGPEIAGAVRAVRQKAIKLHPKSEAFVDIVSPGSVSPRMFEFHLLSAAVAAGAGVKACSHGYGRSRTRHGSADVLNALGINTDVPHPLVERAIDEVGLGYLFPETINRGLAHLNPVREDLGVRTMFGAMVPLSNPINAPVLLIGLPDERLYRVAPEIMEASGVKRGYVALGEGGQGHISVTGATTVQWLDIERGERREFEVKPEEFGINPARTAQVEGSDDARADAELCEALLKDRVGPRRDLVALNAAFAIAALERIEPRDAYARAIESIETGRALKKLNEVRDLYGGPVG